MGRRTALRAISAPITALLALVCACGEGGSTSDTPEVRVHVDRVLIDENDSPVLVLEEEAGTRWLPIWIGSAEARSIALEMEAFHSPRPNSHDLARDVIHGLDAEVVSVVVTELRDGTYYALLQLKSRGDVVRIDARPSDAIAIALRTRAPIFVREPLFAQGAAEEVSPSGSDSPKREI